MERTLIDGAVAEVADRDVLASALEHLPVVPQREREPGAERRLRTDDPVPAVEVVRPVEHVHRPALAAGLAFANKYRGNDNVACTYFGDGAANQTRPCRGNSRPRAP